MTGPSGSNLNPGDSSAPNDPFSALHKMSITAGLGSGDYVAINGMAIASILLGVGSALVLFNSVIFLLLPFFGVTAGIAAWMQISRSNGTQTGREIAVIGFLLSLGFGGFFATKSVYGVYRNHSDETEIVSTVQNLGELLKKNDFDKAYALFDSRFQSQFSRQTFEAQWRSFMGSPYFGSLQYIDWNHLLIHDVDPVDGTTVATGMMLLKAKPDEPYRINMGFRKIDNTTWKIDLMPQIFSIEPPPTAAPGAKEKTSPMFGPPKPT